MMRGVIIAALAIAGTATHAQTEAPAPVCMSVDYMERRSVEIGRVLILRGRAGENIAMRLYASSDGDWTLFMVAGDAACIAAAGDGMTGGTSPGPGTLPEQRGSPL